MVGHFAATRERMAATEDLAFVLHDTTKFTFKREDQAAIGLTKSVNSGRDKGGRIRSHAVCGILMHSTLVLTREGVPLCLAAVKFWTREKFKGTAAAQAEDQPDQGADRAEGERSMAG